MRGVSEISCPALNCWELVWWFPQSLTLRFLLTVGRVSQPGENHCFSEPTTGYVSMLLAKFDHCSKQL